MTFVTRLVGLKNEKKIRKKISKVFLRLFSKKSCSKMCFLFSKRGGGLLFFCLKGVFSARKFNFYFYCFLEGLMIFLAILFGFLFLPSFCTLSTSILCHRIFRFHSFFSIVKYGTLWLSFSSF